VASRPYLSPFLLFSSRLFLNWLTIKFLHVDLCLDSIACSFFLSCFFSAVRFPVRFHASPPVSFSILFCFLPERTPTTSLCSLF
jgi:hypothetical protein